MNLLFRLIWVILRARLAGGRLALLDPVRLQQRVWFTDQDMFMHMTNSRYLSFGDLGRVDAFLRTGLRQALQSQGWRAEISAQTMTINRMLKAPKTFTLETVLQGWNEQYLAIGQTFLRNGRNHASVNTLLRVQTKTGELVAPERVIALLDDGLESPNIPEIFASMITQAEQRQTPSGE